MPIQRRNHNAPPLRETVVLCSRRPTERHRAPFGSCTCKVDTRVWWWSTARDTRSRIGANRCWLAPAAPPDRRRWHSTAQRWFASRVLRAAFGCGTGGATWQDLVAASQCPRRNERLLCRRQHQQTVVTTCRTYILERTKLERRLHLSYDIGTAQHIYSYEQYLINKQTDCLTLEPHCAVNPTRPTRHVVVNKRMFSCIFRNMRRIMGILWVPRIDTNTDVYFK